jgi:hypothetical protein
MKLVNLVVRAAAAFFGAVAAIPSGAQLLVDPVVVPSQPLPFEFVNTRLVVDDCMFDPDTVHVTTDKAITTIVMTPRACLLPGPTRVVDILVGAFAAGSHRVDIALSSGGSGSTVIKSVTFTVFPLAEIAVFPPPPRPLTNYSGSWWNPLESGWALVIQQSATRGLTAAWPVYDAAGRAVWLTIQPGGWTDFRTWTGTVYRTSGPPFFGATFDPALVSATPVGTATLRFEQSPGTVDTASFSYTVDGVSATKTIRRFVF